MAEKNKLLKAEGIDEKFTKTAENNEKLRWAEEIIYRGGERGDCSAVITVVRESRGEGEWGGGKWNSQILVWR